MWSLLKLICGFFLLRVYCNFSVPVNGFNVKEGINKTKKKKQIYVKNNERKVLEIVQVSNYSQGRIIYSLHIYARIKLE